VGSGLTDDDRERFWKAKDSLIGQLIEIRADAITQSMEGEHFSLRFPRFKTLEGLSQVKKFNDIQNISKIYHHLLLVLVLQSCMATPPQNPDNICLIFEEKKVGIKLQ
jgi:hypothetical protein